METLAPNSTYCHSIIRMNTHQPTEFIDLSSRLAALVAEADIRVGVINVQSLHTTTAIVVNEHEPLLLADFAALLANAARADTSYRHDDMSTRTVNVAPGERANGHAHCRALLLGSSVSINVAGGQLQLGRWQRIFLVELDGPRNREVSVLVFGQGVR